MEPSLGRFFKKMTGLNFQKTKKLLTEYRIPFCKERLIHNKKEGLKFIENNKEPFVLKISSSKINHITEVGGLKKHIKTEKDFKKAWKELKANIVDRGIESKIEGYLIQEQVKGLELVVGMKRSREFGPVVMFGLGGIMVEVLKDVSFGVAPLSKSEIKKMIKEIKTYKILKEFRGRPAINLEKVIQIISAVAKLSLENPEIKEIDFNPVIANEEKSLVVDTSILYE
jgi:hypothetical protein